MSQQSPPPTTLLPREGHTPGEWRWGLDDIDAVWAVDCPEDGGNVICEPPSAGLASQSRWPHNARLISASPTMYDYITRCAAAGDQEAQQILEKIHAG